MRKTCSCSVSLLHKCKHHVMMHTMMEYITILTKLICTTQTDQIILYHMQSVLKPRTDHAVRGHSDINVKLRKSLSAIICIMHQLIMMCSSLDSVAFNNSHINMLLAYRTHSKTAMQCNAIA